MYYVIHKGVEIDSSDDLKELRAKYNIQEYIILTTPLERPNFKLKKVDTYTPTKNYWDFSKIPVDELKTFVTNLSYNNLERCKDIIHKHKVGVVCCVNDNITFVRNKYNEYVRRHKENT